MKRLVFALPLFLIAGFLIGFVLFGGFQLGVASLGGEVVSEKLQRVKATDIETEVLSQTDVSVKFKTSESVSAKLDYGTSTLYGVQTSESAVSTEHSFNLRGLLPGKAHYFRILMKDQSGEIFASRGYLFKSE